jgi:hypothetical protein
MIGDNPNIGQVLTNNKTGVVTASYSDDAVSKGQAFEVRKRITLTTKQVYDVVLDSTALVAANKGLFIDPLSMSTGGGMVFVDTFAVDTYTGGDAIVPLKLNTTKTQVAECVFKKGVTIGNIISDPREYIVGTLSTNQSSGGGSMPIEVSKQFTPGVKIVARFSNQEDATVYFDFGIVFYEPQF